MENHLLQLYNVYIVLLCKFVVENVQICVTSHGKTKLINHKTESSLNKKSASAAIIYISHFGGLLSLAIVFF